MPRHATVRVPLWDALMAYLTLVVAYLSLTVQTGRHALREAARSERPAFGADEAYAAELHSMRAAMAETGEIPVPPRDEWLDLDTLFDRTQDARDRYEECPEWPCSDVDREEVDA